MLRLEEEGRAPGLHCRDCYPGSENDETQSPDRRELADLPVQRDVACPCEPDLREHDADPAHENDGMRVDNCRRAEA
jgi:hypothetical protein